MFAGERCESVGWDPLPEGLADMAPGPELGTALASIDCDRLSGYDRVEVMKANARMVAHHQAGMFDAIDSIHSYETENPDNLDTLPGSLVDDLAASEVQAGLTLTRRSADWHLGLAFELRQRLPSVWNALRQGEIDLARARVMIDQTRHLDVDVAQEIVEKVLPLAPDRTTGQLRARLARLCITHDPDSARMRYEQGLEERRVVTQANEDGTADLHGLNLPAHLGRAAMKRINRLARAARRKDDSRTMDQVRADVLLDLLCGSGAKGGAGQGTVDIRVDLTTLMELSDAPAELPGFGPLIADIARKVVAEQPESEHRVTVTDRGEVVWAGTTRRRPTAQQRRMVEAENPTCVFPGCRMPAAECDIDHRHPYAQGGRTRGENLAPACRHDHIRKHGGWKVVRLGPGRYIWTSPLGHTYHVGPDPP